MSSAKQSKQFSDIVGRFAASTGELSSLIQNPCQLSEEDGFLTEIQKHFRPGTIKVYLMALWKFALFAAAKIMYEPVQCQSVMNQIMQWNSSLRVPVRKRMHERRIDNENQVEEPAKSMGKGLTEDGELGKKMLQQKYTKATNSEYMCARNYLIVQLIKNNGSRSGTIINLTWEQVADAKLCDGMWVVRTFNKTLGSHGMANVVISPEENGYLGTLYDIQCLIADKIYKFVFTTTTGQQLPHNHISRAITSVYGVSASSTLLRKAIVVAWHPEGMDKH